MTFSSGISFRFAFLGPAIYLCYLSANVLMDAIGEFKLYFTS